MELQLKTPTKRYNEKYWDFHIIGTDLRIVYNTKTQMLICMLLNDVVVNYKPEKLSFEEFEELCKNYLLIAIQYSFGVN